MKKLSARAHISNNRLYISIGGKLTRESLDKLYTDIRFGVADLKPGFNVITDLTECTLASLNGVPTFKKIANFLIENRVGLVVRVMNSENLVFKQLLNLTARMQGYKAISVSSIEEAEKILLEAEKRESLRFQLHQQRIKYLINDEEGEGYILDISTGGCAIDSATLKPSVEDDIFISIPFDTTENLLNSFNTTARVVKEKNGFFSVQFKEYDINTKEQLWQRLVYESKIEKSAEHNHPD